MSDELPFSLRKCLHSPLSFAFLFPITVEVAERGGVSQDGSDVLGLHWVVIGLNVEAGCGGPLRFTVSVSVCLSARQLVWSSDMLTGYSGGFH